MLQMRKNVFETNSSSTHSITMCSQDEYDAWVNGKVLLNDGWWSKDNESEFKDKKFVTRAEAEDIIKKDKYYNGEDLSKFRDDELSNEYQDDDGNWRGHEYGFYTFKNYLINNECLEWFDETYVTPSGETVVAFGMYGHDW